MINDQVNAIKDEIENCKTHVKQYNEDLERLSKQVQDKLELYVPTNETGEVDIKDVKSLSQLQIEKVLGEGAFGVVSLIKYKG